MTAKEYAYDLVLRFQFKQEGVRKELAKRSALICTNELIRIAKWGGDFDGIIEEDSKEFYMEVKKQIELL